MKRVLRIFLLTLIALTLICSAGLCAEQSKGKEKKAAPKRATKEEKEKALLQWFQNQINAYAAESPPNYRGMAQTYLSLFEAFSKYQHGKMAAWEAYELFLKVKDYDLATALLTRIMSSYRYSDTMDNPLDPDVPIGLRATARVELARLYALRGDLLTAISIARTVPNQYPGANVGRFSGDRTYYGKVEIVCGLDSADYAIRVGNFNQAVILLLDLIRGHKGQSLGTYVGPVEMEYEAVKIGCKAVFQMPASLGKRLSILDEMSDAADSPLAKCKILFYKAEAHIAAFEQAPSKQQVEDAFAQYRLVLEKFPSVMLPQEKDKMLLSVAAVADIRKLIIVQGKDPKRALYELTRIEDEYAGTDDADKTAIAAYARFYGAMVSFQNLNNPRQAVYDLEILLEKYTGVPAYPVPKDTDSPPSLSDHVKKVLIKVREKNL